MFARISTFKMKPESVPAAEEKLQELMPTIMGMEGMVTFTNVIDADGNGVVVSVVATEEQLAANQEQVGKIWAEFQQFLEEAPVVGSYRVMAHQSN